jgi:hypothetical protein
VALGLAVDQLMSKPAFASRPFGEGSRVLLVNSIAVIMSSLSTAPSVFKDSSAGLVTRAKTGGPVEGRHRQALRRNVQKGGEAYFALEKE